MNPRDWVRVTDHGLYVPPGDFYVDPVRSVRAAVITHGHADHARPGHDRVLATPETLAVMERRIGREAYAQRPHPLPYGEAIRIGEVRVRLAPAGHVLGSAQAVLEHRGQRVVVTGDYKRHRDPTVVPFEPVPADVLVTEATFGLPVFRHPPAEQEVAKLLASRELFPERSHLVGAYSLGKAQRLIAHLREAGYHRPIFIHGALEAMCRLYEEAGVALGELRPATGTAAEAMRGEIVIAPPGALRDRWARRLPDPVTVMASGWMRVRARARQRGAELPLVISDHADWEELIRTIDEVDPGEVWVTHGREDALVHYCRSEGRRAEALSLVGYEDDADDAPEEGR